MPCALQTAPIAERPVVPGDEIVYRIAQSKKERMAAFRLVYQAYRRAGLAAPNPFRMRVTPYHLLDTTDVFVAVLRGQVISTVSLVGDGELGLPLEDVYRDVVRPLRQQSTVGEVSCLADRRRKLRRYFGVFVELNRLMVQKAQQRGIERLLVAVHPRHAPFYQRCLGFQPVGDRRDYPAARNNPAVVLCLDFNQVSQYRAGERQARLHRRFMRVFDRCMRDPVPDEQIASGSMRETERSFFSQVAQYWGGFCPLPYDEPTSAETDWETDACARSA